MTHDTHDTLEDREQIHKWGMAALVHDPLAPNYALHELGMTIVVVGQAIIDAIRRP